MLIAIIFLHFFYVVSYLEGALCHGSTLIDLLQKSETDSDRKILFLEIYDFGTKNQQNRGRFKVLRFWDKKLTKLG